MHNKLKIALYNVKVTKAVTRSCSIKEIFLKISQNSQENTCAVVSFLIKVADWRLDACRFIKNTLQHRCSPVNLDIFFRTFIRLNTYERLVMKLEILEDRLIYFIEKIVYSKTNIQQEMFGEKMFCGKCSDRVIEISDEKS